MTEKFQGAILRCDGKIKESHLQAAHAVRHVALAEKIVTPKGEAILVGFERDIRDDDFKDGVGKALKAFKFVKKVEPVQGDYFLSDVHDHVTRILDLTIELKPKPAPEMTPEATAEYVGRVRSWIRVRKALYEATQELLHPRHGGESADRR